jgi:hypothetical protein
MANFSEVAVNLFQQQASRVMMLGERVRRRIRAMCQMRMAA